MTHEEELKMFKMFCKMNNKARNMEAEKGTKEEYEEIGRVFAEEDEKIERQVEQIAKDAKKAKVSMQDMYEIGIDEYVDTVIETVTNGYKHFYIATIPRMLERQNIDYRVVEDMLDVDKFYKEEDGITSLTFDVEKLCSGGLIDLESLATQTEKEGVLQIGEVKFRKHTKEEYDKVLFNMFQKEVKFNVNELRKNEKQMEETKKKNTIKR